ncbi:MAG: hypothetical protein VW577_06655 [Pelagibacteraceae bacterium]
MAITNITNSPVKISESITDEISITHKLKIQEDNLLVLIVYDERQGQKFTWPVGFTELTNIASNRNGQLAIATKVAGPSEPSFYSVKGSSDKKSLILYALTGAYTSGTAAERWDTYNSSHLSPVPVFRSITTNYNNSFNIFVANKNGLDINSFDNSIEDSLIFSGWKNITNAFTTLKNIRIYEDKRGPAFEGALRSANKDIS